MKWTLVLGLVLLTILVVNAQDQSSPGGAPAGGQNDQGAGK